MTLGSKAGHGWRWIATAFSFLMFGIGGVLISVFVVPFLYLLSGTRSIREQRGKKVIHYAFRLFIWFMKSLGVLTYQISDVEKLRDARLVVANHPSLIDIIFLIALVPNANCVVKSKLFRNPFTGGVLKVAGYIVNTGDAEDVIDAAAKAFKKGHALIIFPEGTRTTPLQPIKFKRGAANVAVRSQADITPVLIECQPTTLTKSDRWYQVPDKRVSFRLQVKDQLKIAPYLKNVSPSKGARMLTRDLTNYFSKEIGLHE
jgi:1-acyl-sn-glycerol-3-phosphate acyltransferase